MSAFARVIVAVLAGWTVAQAAQAGAPTFPSKPIRIVAPGVGGSSDFTARLIAQSLTPSLGQQVIVDNRPNGVIPGEIVANATPDGHTVLLYGSTVWLMPFMRSNMPYDPVRDLAPITLATTSPNILVVHPALGLRTVKELIAFARAKPGALNYATSGTGNATHIAGELFKAMAGVDIVRINYKAAGTALNDVIAGQVQLMFATAGSATPHMRSGRLAALAVTSARPSPLAPGLPTVAASGLSDYESTAINGVFAPARTPAAIIERLNYELARVLNRPDVKDKLLAVGAESGGSTPLEFALMIKSEMSRVGKLIRDAGIRDE